MSRSRKTSPFHGATTARSEKADKQRWHRVLRRRQRQALKAGQEPPIIREVSDPWNMSKDGKRYAPGWDKVWRK